MTLVACIGGGQLGRMLGLAGLPLGLELRFLDPVAGRVRAGGRASSSSATTATPTALDRLARRRGRRHLRVRERPRRGRRRASVPSPAPRALERGQDRLHEKELFRSLGDPDGAVRHARGDGAARARQVAAARLRRQGPAAGRRGRSALGEGELAEELVPFDRELSIVGVRGRDGETRFWPVGENVHRDGILRVTRAPARGRAAARGRGDLRGAAGRARLRRRPRRRALRGRRPAARERVRAAGAQHRALDDRRRGDEPVREPPAGDPRPAARVDGRARAVA